MLEDLRAQSAATANAAVGPATLPRCEVIARLEAAPLVENGRLTLRATPLFDGPYTSAGETVTVTVREALRARCEHNLAKGAGGEPGSVLVFGGTAPGAGGQLQTGWINTAISAAKQAVGDSGHAQRTVTAIFAQAPELQLTNVTRQHGEPAVIRWPLTQDHVTLRVQQDGEWRDETRRRDWLLDKLNAAWAVRERPAVKINQWLPILHTQEAWALTEAEALPEVIADIAERHPYGRPLVRVSDGDETTTTLLPYRPATQSPDAYAAQLLERVPGVTADGEPAFDRQTGEVVDVDRTPMVPGVDNALLLAAAERGELRLEIMPKSAQLLSTKNAPGLQDDIARLNAIASNRALTGLRLAFGQQPDAVSRVALVFQPQGERRFVVGGPYRLDSGPEYRPETVPTSALVASVAPTPAAQPVAEAPVAASRATTAAATVAADAVDETAPRAAVAPPSSVVGAAVSPAEGGDHGADFPVFDDKDDDVMINVDGAIDAALGDLAAEVAHDNATAARQADPAVSDASVADEAATGETVADVARENHRTHTATLPEAVQVLLTEAQREQLLENGRQRLAGKDNDLEFRHD